jgi:hypothetical protein
MVTHVVTDTQISLRQICPSLVFHMQEDTWEHDVFKPRLKFRACEKI